MAKPKREVKRSICFFCHDRCGVLVHLEDGKPVKIEGDREHFRRGHTCLRCRAALEHLDHPERLNYPLKRAGERGENKWQQISWEQALDEIAERLKKIKNEYGPEALVLSEGTSRNTAQWLKWTFGSLFGTPNVISSGISCYCNTRSVALSIYGWHTQLGASLRPGVTKCIVVWGQNPKEASPTVNGKRLRPTL